MKIALIGTGKMGKAIEDVAIKRNHEIILRLDADNFQSYNSDDLGKADVAFEFTSPQSAVDNLMMCFNSNVPVVCGTTGWLERFNEIENYVKTNNKSFFYASNFSIGVNLVFEINILLARLMKSQPQYDEVLIHESHHAGKLDSPSGTAITLANQIIENIGRLKHWKNYAADENIHLGTDTGDELSIFSSREDDIIGTHIVKYFSDNDEIEIIHKALSRTGFATGAVMAAEWLQEKQGVFSMKDLLKQ
jgi:4-hydroxy-tetrahydrodipicolinate reductase